MLTLCTRHFRNGMEIRESEPEYSVTSNAYTKEQRFVLRKRQTLTYIIIINSNKQQK